MIFFKLSVLPSNFLFIPTQGLFIETREFFPVELEDGNRVAEYESRRPCWNMKSGCSYPTDNSYFTEKKAALSQLTHSISNPLGEVFGFVRIPVWFRIIILSCLKQILLPILLRALGVKPNDGYAAAKGGWDGEPECFPVLELLHLPYDFVFFESHVSLLSCGKNFVCVKNSFLLN
jgi:hypothetical protein